MLMVQLSLPIKNMCDPIEEPTENGVKDVFSSVFAILFIKLRYRTCDNYKMVKYNNCDGGTIIESILKGIEFTQFSIDYYQKQRKLRKDSSEKVKRVKVRVPVPLRIREIQQKYQSEQKDLMPRNQFENSLLKPNLEKMI